MKILMLSIDSKLFEEGSAVRGRIQKHVAYAPDWEFHIIVHTKPGRKEERIAPNAWVYPTNTRYRPLYLRDGFLLARGIFAGRGAEFLVTSQEAMTNLLGVFLKWMFGTRLEAQIHTDFLSPYFIKESFTNSLRFLGYCVGVWAADGVRVVAARMQEELVQKLHVHIRKIRILPIFVDVKDLENRAAAFDLRKKYPQFTHIILMVGRITREKNYSLALAVLRQVRQRYPDTGLLIVGEGIERQCLVQTVAASDNAAQVIFEGQQNDLVSYYKGADVFLHASNYEGYGLVFVEAAVAGVPIVSTNVGIMGGVLEDGRDALIGSVGDTDALALAIQKIFSDADHRERLTASAHQTVMAHAYKSREDYLQQYKEAWERCFRDK